ncbi:hypothetical protein FQR65_LT19136 [Abscondita terminalis]|nr:hypothetical protein FQR65_LT19136 [Abscondita terminalis]
MESRHLTALNKLKELITQPPTLSQFDPSKLITIQCDVAVVAAGTVDGVATFLVNTSTLQHYPATIGKGASHIVKKLYLIGGTLKNNETSLSNL